MLCVDYNLEFQTLVISKPNITMVLLVIINTDLVLCYINIKHQCVL